MAIYKGHAYVSTVAALGARYWSVGFTEDTTNQTPGDDPAGMDISPATSINMWLRQSTSGATPPDMANQVIVSLYEADTNTLLDSVTVSPSTTQTLVTLHPTDTGLETGTPVIGDYRLVVRAVRTSVGTYDVNSDANGDSGIVRINPDSMIIQAWHNGIANPASWGDNIEVNIDLSHGYNLARPHRQFDIEVRNSTTDVLYAARRTEGTDPKNAIIVVDDRFPAAEVGANIDTLAVSVPSAIAPTSEPDAVWVLIPVGTPDRVDGKKVRKGPIPVDASVNVDHHLQINDNDPAIAKDMSPKQRLVSDLGFVGFRLANARDEGLNGIEAREVLRDQRGLVAPAIDRIVTTAPFLGQDGWSASLASWDSALPGGIWQHEVTITTLAADTSEVNGTEPYTLLAINPNLQVVVGAGHPDAAIQSEHWHPGDTLLIGTAVYDAAHKHLEPVDTDIPPTVVIGRFHTATGQAQYLTDQYTWVHLGGAASAYEHPLVQSAGDPRVWLTQLPPAITQGFSNATLFFIATLHVEGTPYNGIGDLDAPGPASPHGRSYEVMTSGGPVVKGDHWSPGDTFQAGLAVIDMATGGTVTVDGYKEIALVRLQDSGLNAGRGEFLEADGLTWTPMLTGASVYFHPLAETRPDGSDVYIKNFTDTADWGDYDIFTLGRAKVGFFEFHNFMKEIGVGPHNQHAAPDGYSIDPIAFALHGIVSQR